MANWNFNEQNVEEFDFPLIPIGDYRVRLEDVEETTSSTNKPMYKMKVKVSGYAGVVFHYLVFDESNTQMVDTKLSQIFNSFKIPKGNLDVGFWKGKVGGAKIKHEIYQGETRAKISFFLSQQQMDKLPPWQESAGVASVSGNSAPSNAPFDATQATELAEDDIQF